MKVFLGYILKEKNLSKVYGICLAENIASERVMEKCAFIKESEGEGEYQGESKNIAKYVFIPQK